MNADVVHVGSRRVVWCGVEEYFARNSHVGLCLESQVMPRTVKGEPVWVDIEVREMSSEDSAGKMSRRSAG